MKIHIIVFCQVAPKGAAPPPQWASTTAAWRRVMSFLSQ